MVYFQRTRTGCISLMFMNPTQKETAYTASLALEHLHVCI